MDLTKKKELFSYDYSDRFAMENYEYRYLFLDYEVNECVISDIVYYILRFNMDDEGIPVEKRKPITLFINSPGGFVFDGWCVCDAIKQSITPVYTVNLGLTASMAFIIYLAGHKRFTMPHATFLMHDGSTLGFGSAAKVKDQIEFETGKMEQMTRAFIMERTNIKPDFYEAKYRVEFYFLPDEAKELGVAHYIIGEDCTMQDILYKNKERGKDNV